MKRSSTTTAPQAFYNDAYPSTKDRSYCKKYTRGLAVITRRPEPLLETPSDKVSTGRPRWPTPLELSAPASAGPAGRSSGRGLATLGAISAVSATLPRPRGSAPRPPGGRLGTSTAARHPRVPVLRETDPPAHSDPTDNTHHLVVCCVGSGPRRSLAEGTRGLHAPAGRHRQILQVDRGPTLQKAPGGFSHLLVAIDKFSKWIEVRPLTSIRSEQAVAFFTNIIHRFGVPNSIIRRHLGASRTCWSPSTNSPSGSRSDP